MVTQGADLTVKTFNIMKNQTCSELHTPRKLSLSVASLISRRAAGNERGKWEI